MKRGGVEVQIKFSDTFCTGDEDISHVSRGNHQRRNQAEGGGASGGAGEGRVWGRRRRGARLQPADRGAPPETQCCPQDGEDEGEGTGKFGHF